MIFIKNLLRTFSILLVSFSFSSVSFAKSKTADLDDIITDSDLIAVVDVVAINSGGKSKKSSAKATLFESIVGDENKDVISMQWNGIAVTEIGRWLVFLKRSDGGYQATLGARSFWKLEYADLDKVDCCSPFAVIRPPIDNLNVKANLVSEQPVYINGVPSGINPIRVKGIKMSGLKTYINSVIKKDELHENDNSGRINLP